MRWLCSFVGAEGCSRSPPDGYYPVPFGACTVYVTGDYLRPPFTYRGLVAQAIAAHSYLPTPELVEAIHRAANVHLEPQPIAHDGHIGNSMKYLAMHERMIARQLNGRTGLISGHKKDIVWVNRSGMDGRIWQYGWIRGDGRRIQPLGNSHGENYWDYSMAARFVHRYALCGRDRVELSRLVDGLSHFGDFHAR